MSAWKGAVHMSRIRALVRLISANAVWRSASKWARRVWSMVADFIGGVLLDRR